jgi:hypothetical protein
MSRRTIALALLLALVGGCHLRSGDRPIACGTATPCAPSQYCDYDTDLCGKSKRPGICKPRPKHCDHYEPVCGCDGKVYGSLCEAAAAGVDASVNGGCRERVPDWIPCGGRFCEARTSYCEIVLSDVFEWPSDYVCRPLPTECAPMRTSAPDCGCFPRGTKCLSFCGVVDTAGVAGFRMTCRR